MDVDHGARNAILVLIVATAFLFTPATAGTTPESEDTPESCGGTAPMESWCTLEATGVLIQWGSDYTGTLETVVAHDAGERRLWCTIDEGNLMACESEGHYPPMGSPVTVECWSLWERAQAIPWLKTGMDGTPQTAPGGIAGGTGQWSCHAGS